MPLGKWRAALLPALVAVGCGGTTGDGGSEGPGERPAEGAENRPANCPAEAPAPDPLPGVDAKHRRLAYWLKRAKTHYGEIDAPLLSATEIDDHNRALRQARHDDRPIGQRDILSVDRDRLGEEVRNRLAYLHERVTSGEYVDRQGERLSGDARGAFETPGELPEIRGELRLAVEPVPLRCGPREAGLYTEDPDPEFDRNNCSTIHPQEPVQILATWSNGMYLARTGYALGWVTKDAALSPPVPDEWRGPIADGARLELEEDAVLEADEGDATQRLGAGVLLAQAPDGSGTRVLFATREGVHRSAPLPEEVVRSTQRALTREAVLQEAFRLLGTPYGWGGHEAGRDCSRFLLDVFATFGLQLPRHSGRQALAGTFSIDVSDIEKERRRRLLIEAAARKGIVLLHFPGHIMLYLGRTDDGRPMAIHSFAEYVDPCEGTEGKGPDGGRLETLYRVDEVSVSDLSLGRGSSRTAFIERLTKIVVLGEPPGVELEGIASTRPAAPIQAPASDEHCSDSLDAAVFQSPGAPHPGRPLRVIATTTEDPRPARLSLVGPDGTRRTPETTRLGGPPWTWWVQVDRPTPGRWTAVLGDGKRVEACERFRVYAGAPPPPERATEKGPAWEPRWKWEEDTENLYSAFVEQLFTEPVEEDVTWPHLQKLLANPERNLLYNHLGLEEDDTIHLEPDCADLPYFLRAYFAWKAELPFGFRRCSRGAPGVPPMCGEEVHSNLDPVEASDPVAAFRRFMTNLKNGVHSGSARTAPDAERTDLYPVPLTRRALRPGTVFADPHGHLLVVAAWRPQRLDHYGVLVGADAQPDGTVGRRRFWRGSFLFTTDTSNAGAGFKGWRPVVHDENEASIRVVDNETLSDSEAYVRYSEQQYEGKARDFYERMEALINPRPLDPVQKQLALVDALDEAVSRRVNSVENAVEYMEQRDWAPIEMPTGYDIFETTGAWENYSTPARDMRLLISIDAVMQFADAVRRSPKRFGLEKGDELEQTIEAMRERLDEELESRAFEYTRSDGSSWELTLEDVVDRAKAFEMSYHPNDCVEIRWAAPKGSDERSTCDQHAPPAHKARMRTYREWFHNRQRPPRSR